MNGGEDGQALAPLKSFASILTGRSSFFQDFSVATRRKRHAKSRARLTSLLNHE